ncbi:hypothetical protein [Mucilaginibacter agri]|uniref:Thioredoxin domain-containing protein n=1 Tax=Mucilaginibacter agri TaxID=2695265 RepID=A0A965ZJC8_9SPHI|nr:hypothetical protein [Mucilaginibacter agri]NCD71720.1 hypothetical protein [Mucilaginibacter agri]
MKGRLKIVLVFTLLFNSSARLLAQDYQTHWPAFKIGRTDASYYGGEDLQPRSKVLFVYFLPDCDDCQHFTTKLLEQRNRLQGFRVIMITNTPLQPLRAFETKYHLKQYPGIVAGTEGSTFVFQRAFHIQQFPFAVLYANGRQLKTFSGDAIGMVQQIVDAVDKNQSRSKTP